MKIEIILPDEAIAGTLTYLSVENGEGFLNNVVLNDLEDGNLYTINDTKMDEVKYLAIGTRQVGEWIDDNCSVCGQYVHHGDARNYCPNCGAKMEVDNET